MMTRTVLVWAVIALIVLSFVGLDLYYALNP